MKNNPSFLFSFLLLLFCISQAFGISTPDLNYRMDECSWDSDDNTYEIKNYGSAGNDYNSTAENDANVTSGKINSAGDFDTKYMKLKNTFTLGDSWSSTFWVKFPLVGSDNQVELESDGGGFAWGHGYGWGNTSVYKVYTIGSVEGVGDIGLFLENSSGDYQFAVYDNDGNTKSVDIPDLDDGWHFFAITKKSNETYLYIDGDDNSYKVDTGTNGDLTLVGTSTDNSDDETIGATMDEFKIWNSTLSQSDIETIYDNENSGKNYDGTNRAVVVCRFEPIVDYHMDECSWDNDNNTYEIKNYGTDGSDYNATAGDDANTTEGELCRGGDINSTDEQDKYILPKNDISLPDKYTLTLWVKFPLNSDGHSVFSTSGGFPMWGSSSNSMYYNIADRPGSSNDYIYYSNKDGDWYLCVYGNDYECQSYNPNSLDGWHFLTFLVDGDTTKYFVDGESNLTFSQSPSSVDLGLIFNSDYGSSTDNQPNKQSIGSDVDEFKIFDRILTDSEIENIYDNEKDGKNYDGTSRICPNCSNEDENETTKNFKFDAWDTFRSIDDRNISTKIVKQAFDLTIASLDENGTDYQEFNGTVCAKIDNNISRLIFREQNTSTATFSISKAIKDIKVELSWKKNVEEDCPLVGEDNSTLSSDNLAIRPKKFNIELNSTSFYAGVSFRMDFNATDFDGVNTTDYNETDDSSRDTYFVFDINDTNPSCKTGVLENLPSPLQFKDGNISFNTNYSEVGHLNLSIKEPNTCDDRFARVDCDDKDVAEWSVENNLSITPFEINITIIPHHFEVNAALKNHYNKDNFTYYSNDLNMSAILDVNITAQNEQNETTKNYNTVCYAKDIDINISTNTRDDLPKMLYIYEDIKEKNSTIHKGVMNVTYRDGNFTTDDNGSTKVRFYINFDRNRSVGINPFELNVTDVNITDVNGTFGESKPDKNATFYYGRVKTKDISTNQNSISHSLHVEIYSTLPLPFHQNSLNWYEGSDDSDTDIILLSPQDDFIYNEDKNKSGLTISPSSSLAVISAKADFNISNDWDKSDSAYVHVKIPAYLWYSKYEDYNDTNMSDCSFHPCFKYDYFLKSNDNGIYSGDFNGSTIGDEYNATRTKIGVKVFR